MTQLRAMESCSCEIVPGPSGPMFFTMITRTLNVCLKASWIISVNSKESLGTEKAPAPQFVCAKKCLKSIH